MKILFTLKNFFRIIMSEIATFLQLQRVYIHTHIFIYVYIIIKSICKRIICASQYKKTTRW
jgi:hypothetical protein